MSDKRRAEQIDEILDGLESPTVEDVSTAMREFDADDVAAAAAHKALAGAGGTPDQAAFSAEIQPCAPANFDPSIVVPLIISRALGNVGLPSVQPPLTYAAGPVLIYQPSGISNIDTSDGDYNFGVSITVTDTDGTNVLQISGRVTANAGAPDDGVTLNPGDMSVSITNGDDLSYDPDTGTVSSASGGIYSYGISLSGGWD